MTKKQDKKAVRSVAVRLLPVTQDLVPFVPLEDPDVDEACELAVGGCSREWVPSYRALDTEGATDAGVVPPALLARAGLKLDNARADLRKYQLPKGKVIYHLGRCTECEAEVVKIGLRVRVELGAGLVLEREYAL